MIEVRITGSEIMQRGSVTFVPFLMTELRKVGIPVKGFFSFQGVERGKLWWFQDYWSTDMIFRWEE